MKINKPKILLYDLETSYTLSATWGLFDQNVAKVIREPFIISVAWKWLGEKQTHVLSLPDFNLYKKDKFNDKELVKKLWELFEKADIIIAHNGNGFDQKWSYGRFVIHELKPPSPSKYIDTLLIARSKFKFNSNKLNDLAKYFKIGTKIQTGGIELWYNCIEKFDKKSWNLMCNYNKQDVILLEKVYLKLLPYITNHPNIGLMQNEVESCPNCGSCNMQRRGFSFSRISKFQRWWCIDCGGWSQSTLEDNSQIR